MATGKKTPAKGRTSAKKPTRGATGATKGKQAEGTLELDALRQGVEAANAHQEHAEKE